MLISPKTGQVIESCVIYNQYKFQNYKGRAGLQTTPQESREHINFMLLLKHTDFFPHLVIPLLLVNDKTEIVGKILSKICTKAFLLDRSHQSISSPTC